MTVELVIRDGDPWWMSPDVWVVPGEDPEGAPGTPVVGQNAYMWAHVRNNGTSTVNNAEVRFYWADPSTAFDRNTAHYVGSSFVSLGSGDETDVLLLVPWIPEFVNNGHECILAEAFHPSQDPLPATPAFNVPTDDHVAQRNLTVVLPAASGLFHLNFNAFNTSRKPDQFTLVAEVGNAESLKPLLKTLGADIDIGGFNGQVTNLGFINKSCPEAGDLDNVSGPKLEIEIPGHRKKNLSVMGKVNGGPALIHVTQYHNDRIIGGLSFILRAARSEKTPKRHRS
jgi:hypothetical protein